MKNKKAAAKAKPAKKKKPLFRLDKENKSDPGKVQDFSKLSTFDYHGLSRKEYLKNVLDSMRADPSFDPRLAELGLIPRQNSVLLMRATEDSKTKSGLIIPETSEQKVNVGVIYALGPKADEDLKPGMKVLFNFYADTEIMIDDKLFLIMSDIDIKIVLPQKGKVLLRGKSDAEKRREHKMSYTKGV